MRFVLVLIPVFLLAFDLNLSVLLTKPKSYVRDFYLTQFMRETNSSVLAYKAYSALYSPKPYLHWKILSKFKFFKPIYECLKVTPQNLRKVSISCVLAGGLSLKEISKLNEKDLKYLYDRLPDGETKSAVWAFLHNDFSKIFKNKKLGYYFILNYPNKKIDQSVSDFKPFEDSYFYLFVKSAVLNDLPLIEKSLSKLNYEKFSDRTKWWLFLDEMKLKNYKKAYEILKSINYKTDKVYFWLWELSGKKEYADYLLNEPQVNFYTLYLHEEYDVPFDIRNKILFNTVKNPPFVQTNPWSVLKFFDVLKRTKGDALFKLAKKLDSNKSVALKALVLEKAFRYKVNFFITPPFYKDKNTTFRAFVYAIARQESMFIPASVSNAYALGTMQLMPFLVRAMHGNVFSQFDYSQNVKLGVKYLKWLFSKLHNPLMVAYAYNGGIGFVKRKVLPNFKFKGKYQPFLSMELIPLDQTREYGKKVLANFVIYSHIFGDENVSLHSLLNGT